MEIQASEFLLPENSEIRAIRVKKTLNGTKANAMKSQHLPKEELSFLEKIRKEIALLDSTAEIILYGSRARGDAERDSDYDLLILSDGPTNTQKEDEIRGKLYPISLTHNVSLSLFLLSRRKWKSELYRAMPFHKKVISEGFPI